MMNIYTYIQLPSALFQPKICLLQLTYITGSVIDVAMFLYCSQFSKITASLTTERGYVNTLKYL